jgi:hypothetical protein
MSFYSREIRTFCYLLPVSKKNLFVYMIRCDISLDILVECVLYDVDKNFLEQEFSFDNIKQVDLSQMKHNTVIGPMGCWLNFVNIFYLLC